MAPASSRACLGSRSSDCSNKSVTRMATRIPSSFLAGMVTSLFFGINQLRCAIVSGGRLLLRARNFPAAVPGRVGRLFSLSVQGGEHLVVYLPFPEDPENDVAAEAGASQGAEDAGCVFLGTGLAQALAMQEFARQFFFIDPGIGAVHGFFDDIGVHAFGAEFLDHAPLSQLFVFFAVRSESCGILGVVEIALFIQSRDHRFDNGLG